MFLKADLLTCPGHVIAAQIPYSSQYIATQLSHAAFHSAEDIRAQYPHYTVYCESTLDSS